MGRIDWMKGYSTMIFILFVFPIFTIVSLIIKNYIMTLIFGIPTVVFSIPLWIDICKHIVKNRRK
jgi:hypothetical protein